MSPRRQIATPSSPSRPVSVPSGSFTPRQEERLEVLEGSFTIGVRRESLGVGFRRDPCPRGRCTGLPNKTNGPVRVALEFPPALDSERVWETLAVLDRQRKPGKHLGAQTAADRGDDRRVRRLVFACPGYSGRTPESDCASASCAGTPPGPQSSPHVPSRFWPDRLRTYARSGTTRPGESADARSCLSNRS